MGRKIVVIVVGVLFIGCSGGNRVVSDGPLADAAVDRSPISDFPAMPDGPSVDAPTLRDGPSGLERTWPPHDAPRPDLPPVSLDTFVPTDGGGVMTAPFTADDVAKTCALVDACMQQSANTCIRDAFGHGNGPWPVYSCMAKGTTGCAAFSSCTGYDYQIAPCNPSPLMQCSGNNLEVCVPTTPSMKVTLDCQKVFGVGCKNLSGSSQPAGCSSGATCSGTTDYCKGSMMVSCASGVEVLTVSCALTGMPCRDGNCAGPAEPCLGGSVCEAGNTVIAFCIGGYRARVKCSDLGPGFSCVSSSSTGARCQQATQCNPDTSPNTETCAGSKVELCSGGKMVQVDCTALGFSGCSAGRCVP